MPSTTLRRRAGRSRDLLRAERDRSVVAHRPQTVALEAEVLEAQAGLALVRHHVGAPVLEVLDAAELDRADRARRSSCRGTASARRRSARRSGSRGSAAARPPARTSAGGGGDSCCISSRSGIVETNVVGRRLAARRRRRRTRPRRSPSRRARRRCDRRAKLAPGRPCARRRRWNASHIMPGPSRGYSNSSISVLICLDPPAFAQPRTACS